MSSVICALILFWHCNGTLGFREQTGIVRFLWLWEQRRNIKRQETNLQIEGMIRGELSYLAPLGSENFSAPYFKQCFFQGGGYYPPDSQTPRLPVPRQK